MNVFEFIELLEAHRAHQEEEMLLRATQACWIINSMPTFSKRKRRALKPSDLVRRPGEEVYAEGLDGKVVTRTRGRQRRATKEYMERQKDELYEAFKDVKGPYGRPRRFKSIDRR